MIEKYSFGSIMISGKSYTSDVKIIDGRVVADWSRQSGHRVEIDDIRDILEAKPDYLVIGSGKFGIMKVGKEVINCLQDRNVELVVKPTASAVKTFNRLTEKNSNVAAGFHLTC